MLRCSGNWEVVRRVLARLWPQRRPPTASLHGAVPLLALVPEGPNRLALQSLLDRAAWALTLSDIPSTAAVPPIVIFDRDLFPGQWREILREITAKSPRPYLIVLSAQADSNLWDEVQRAGGCDILRTPITRDALAAALTKGRQIWFARQQLRQAPAVRQ